MGSCEPITTTTTSTTILLILPFQVARIAGMSHWHPAYSEQKSFCSAGLKLEMQSITLLSPKINNEAESGVDQQ
jgi:hypothetical protein